MAQLVKEFVQGRCLGFEMNMTPISDQINTYLEQHPNYVARSINTAIGTGYTKAYVIFDIREEKNRK